MKKKLLSLFLLSLICFTTIPTLAIGASSQDFKLDTKEDIEDNAIELNWTSLKKVKNYEIYQKKNNESKFKSIKTIDSNNKNKDLDYSGVDVDEPNLPDINIDKDNKLIVLNSKDNGTKYTYYVKANMKNGSIIKSNKTLQTIKTDIKGYYYRLDNKAFTNIKDIKNLQFTDSSIKMDEINGYNYLHVYAIDNAGNKSSVAHIKVNVIPEITKQPKDISIHNGEKAILKVEVKGDYLSYQWQQKINNDWIDIDNENKDTLILDSKNNIATNAIYRCMISNDITSIYTNEVNIKIVDYYIDIPKEINIDGNTKVGKYEIEKSEDLKNINLKVIPNDKVELSLNGATTFANFEYKDLYGIAKITIGTSGIWQGFTTFNIKYN